MIGSMPSDVTGLDRPGTSPPDGRLGTTHTRSAGKCISASRDRKVLRANVIRPYPARMKPWPSAGAHSALGAIRDPVVVV